MKDIIFDLCPYPFLVSLIFLLEFFEHLGLNLGGSNGDIHLTTSLRLF